MKILLAVVVVLVVAVNGEVQVTQANILGKILKLSDTELAESEELTANCLRKHGIEEKLVVGASKGIFPDHRGLQCFFECYTKGFGTMDANGKQDLSSIKSKAPEHLYNLGNFCISQVEHSDHCVKAYLTYKCFVIEAGKAKKSQ